MTTSAQLERDADACRAEIAHTLDELRSRMSPGEVVNQLVDYARDGSGGQFVRNLRHQVVQNPLPMTLIGLGVAWMMMSGRRTEAMSDQMTERMGRSWRAAGEADTAGEWRDRARDASAKIGEAASATGENMRSAAATAYDTSAQAADQASAKLSSAAASMRDTATDLSQSMMTLFRDQPLVLAGLGIALGAALGAALPATETEDRLMGDASTDVKARAQEMASQGFESAKNVGEHALDEAKREAEKQGLAASPAASTDDQHAERPNEPAHAPSESPGLIPPGGHEAEWRPELDLNESDRDRR